MEDEMTKAEYAKTRFDFYRSLGYVPFAVCWQRSYEDTLAKFA